MVLHYLDRAHTLMVYAVGGYAVFAAEKIGAFDVELVDVLALILDSAIVGYIDTGHTLQHIADRAVLPLGEAAYIVGYGVALLADAVGLDSNFLEQGGPGIHIDGQRKTHAVECDGLPCETHHGDFQPAALNRRHSDGEAAVRFRRGEFLYLAVGSLDNDRRTGKRLVILLVDNSTGDIDLPQGTYSDKYRNEIYNQTFHW